jgi:ABC-type nitrate/sulfonate/bicarbonate transport system substrate-binding protein
MKKWIVCLSLVLLTFSLTLPGVAGAQNAKIIVGTTMGNETQFPFHLAVKNGDFKKEGLTLEMKTFVSGPQVMMAMANGELDIVIGTGYPGFFQAVAQGVDAKILLSEIKGSAPVVGGPKIKTFKDLDGKVVGDPGLGTLQNTLLSVAEKKYGIKFKKLIHAKVSDLPIFLEKGEIDAFSSWEWIAAETVYKEKGAHYVLKWPVIPNCECIAIGANGKFLRENPELVRKFLRAYLMGVKYYTDHKKEMPTMLSAMFNEPEDVVKMAMENDDVEDPDINMPSVKMMIEDALRTGRIKKDAVPDVDAFLKQCIDQSMMKQLKQEVGLK